ncbi:MAG: membrane protein insertion efficiency factor YidD [Acidobacteria bacterium]|nr:MAG: membrane protein insertion efficiency factor YidD [Acidobacteriota bacterium]
MSPRPIALAALRVHQKILSPLLPPACRFIPTCSEYAHQAIQRYGLRRGTWMAIKRLARCQPLVKGGLDPLR